MTTEQKPGGRNDGLSAGLGAWISTAERLPSDGQSVAFVVRSTGTFEYLNGRVLGGTYNANTYTGGFSVPGLTIGASFWMPLPPAPNDALAAARKGRRLEGTVVRDGENAMSERQACTKERPFTEGAAGYWMHPDAKRIDEEYNGLSGGGDYERYECPHCGIRFRVELPD